MFESVLELSVEDRRPSRWSPTFYQHLQPYLILEGHEGCVNSVSWSADGCRLTTGSDDQHIKIWSSSTGVELASIETEHSDNIFASRWMPCDDRVVSCARDGAVGIYKVSETDIVTDWFAQVHDADAMRLALVDETTFLSCSLDGRVCSFDSRNPGEYTAILDFHEEQVSINSVSVSAIKPEFLAVGGSEPAVSIYDRRMMSRPWMRWLPDLGIGRKEVSSVCFSPKTDQLAVSYLRDGIFTSTSDHASASPNLFSDEITTWRELVNQALRTPEWYEEMKHKLLDLINRHSAYIRDTNWRRLVADEHFLVAICCRELGQLNQSLKNSLEAYGMIEERPADLLRLVIATIKEMDGPDPSIFIEELGSEDVADLPQLFSMEETTAFKAILSDTRTMYRSTNKLDFHRNIETVKDVTWAGTDCEYIATGSDHGYFCLYSADDGDLVFWGRGDQHVTNVVQQHPQAAILATSGIDSTIKLWEPRMEELSLAEIEEEVRQARREGRPYAVPKHMWDEEQARIPHVPSITPCRIQ